MPSNIPSSCGGDIPNEVEVSKEAYSFIRATSLSLPDTDKAYIESVLSSSGNAFTEVAGAALRLSVSSALSPEGQRQMKVVRELVQNRLNRALEDSRQKNILQ